ncbi:hypothetical protein [Actinomadura sp. SCN-SB]|uniref:hypothetical protein n=1 Tax=Actinomadura sp. SCN-SB TaxID=3373092 RepID=UPI0037524751
MDFKINTDGMLWVVADTPNQRVDFESKAPKLTSEGQPMWQVRLLGMDGAGSAPIRVSVVGDPGLSQGQFVTPRNLVLHVVERKGDAVLWWTADRLDVTGFPDGANGGSASEGTTAGRRGKGGEQ